MGPGCYCTQWKMEWMISNITEEIKQPSKPYMNLTQQAICCTQVNALKAMIPELNPQMKDPCGSEDIGDGYLLLHARDDHIRKIDGPAGEVI
jgi:hypothetical protein